MKIIHFFGTYCSFRSRSCLKHSAKWVYEVEWVSKVKVILWSWSKGTQISKLNVWLLACILRWAIQGLRALLFRINRYPIFYWVWYLMALQRVAKTQVSLHWIYLGSSLTASTMFMESVQHKGKTVSRHIYVYRLVCCLIMQSCQVLKTWNIMKIIIHINALDFFSYQQTQH